MSGKAKSKSSRNKHVVSNSGSDVLRTRFGVTSVFQRRQPASKSKGSTRQDNGNIEAFVEQVSFDGIIMWDRVQVPDNSHLWSKLPDRGKESEG